METTPANTAAQELAIKYSCTEARAAAVLKQCDGNFEEACKFFQIPAWDAVQPTTPPRTPSLSPARPAQEDDAESVSSTDFQSPTADFPEASDEESTGSPSEEDDFLLPRIPGPRDLVPGGEDGATTFSLPSLVAAMQRGMVPEKIRVYLDYYDTKTVRRELNAELEGYPSIFYAAATNSERIIRLWCHYGGDVNARHAATGLPLLAFAVVNAEIIQQSTTLMVATLLSIGASASALPGAFYLPFDQDLPDGGPELSDTELLGAKLSWCTTDTRARLARTLNLTQRYYLEKSIKTKRPSIRHRQVAHRRHAEALLGIHYFLIGQTSAANSLMQKLLSALMLPSKRPLVLVFAGPSGHGKTELARKLGHLLSLELEVVDCTIFNRESELFGPRAPFVGSERGSPLNNFLARKAGQRSIVFLDEFEKTTADVHKALLIPFDSGEYQDRRHLTKVDCSKTKWILATNALDETITGFCDKHKHAIFRDEDPEELSRLMKVLSKELRTVFKDQFKPPITGRISAFFPFLHFSSGEQAVVAHKYVQELSEDVRKPVNMSTGADEVLLGNVNLRVRRDASVCNAIAKEGYDRDLGARSLRTAVDTSIKDIVVESYLDVDVEITEGQPVMEAILDIRQGDLDVRFIAPKMEITSDDSEEFSDA